jgi:tRNA-splicing ligase RtcB
VKAKDIQKTGVPSGPLVKLALSLVGPATKAGLKKRQITEHLRNLAADPDAFRDDPRFGTLARAMVKLRAEESSPAPDPCGKRESEAPWRMWGSDIDPAAIEQMRNACRLPVSVQGALMPDAHVGYGLPIGGVLAVDNAVIPYAVGVDIACRMKLTVTDMPVDSLERHREELIRVLESQTLFGAGREFPKPHDHPVMHEDWDFCKAVAQTKSKARGQLGTSGSGNHFVDYGTLTLPEAIDGLPAGTYLAILSHSGSRGAGAAIANHFSKVARDLHKKLPKPMQHLGWLPLTSDAGREYWRAMHLMGMYAAANHEIIHGKLTRALKCDVLFQMENHHNFAWKETHGRRNLIVHRKGATPAGVGVLGMIPGSMASPGFLVRGKGKAASLDSAAHGAGRLLSRNEAKNRFAWSTVKRELDAAGITVLSAGVDEVPGAYKDIHNVMREQADLVEIVARFDPKIVKMARD